MTLYILSYYPCKDTVRLLVSLFYVEGEWNFEKLNSLTKGPVANQGQSQYLNPILSMFKAHVPNNYRMLSTSTWVMEAAWRHIWRHLQLEPNNDPNNDLNTLI